MDAGSDPAFEVMAQSKQGQESPGGDWSCWVSPIACVFSFFFFLSSFFLRAPLCSCFLLFLVLDEQWSRERAELVSFVRHSYRLGNKRGSPVYHCHVDNLIVIFAGLSLVSQSLIRQPGCFARHAVALVSCLLQCRAYQGMQQPCGCLDLSSKENQGKQ